MANIKKRSEEKQIVNIKKENQKRVEGGRSFSKWDFGPKNRNILLWVSLGFSRPISLFDQTSTSRYWKGHRERKCGNWQKSALLIQKLEL